jgi:large subunit ribosomal protein L10
MEKAEKQAELDVLVDSFTRAKVAVCADYRGLTVAQMTELRSELRRAGSGARVVRNTLARLAVERVENQRGGSQDEVAKFLKTMEGPTLVVYSFEDPINPTKVLAKFAKTAKDKFRVKGCWLDGAYVDAAGVDALSTMPGREETFAMLLSLMQAPATRLVRVLSEPGAQVARVVEGYRRKLEEGSAAA